MVVSYEKDAAIMLTRNYACVSVYGPNNTPCQSKAGRATLLVAASRERTSGMLGKVNLDIIKDMLWIRNMRRLSLPLQRGGGML